jgi:FkbM family methyltransferase
MIGQPPRLPDVRKGSWQADSSRIATRGIKMVLAFSSLSPLLAPFVFGLGRAVRSDALVDWSGRLDPMFARAHLHKIRRKGWALDEASRFTKAPQFIAAMNSDCGELVRNNFTYSRSQLWQDIFVVLVSGAKRGGYFVEIGVGDGEKLSNTYLAEKQYGWTGILAEPNPAFHQSIAAKRTSILDRRAVFSQSGKTLDFLMDENEGELSTLVDFDGRDSHVRKGATFPVRTVTLDELLAEHGAPQIIDYMSIDTEGSEYEVLKALDLTKRKVMIFTIESNYDAEKMQKIDSVLLKLGYRIVLSEISLFDTWYLHPDAVNKFA